jgi:hypothetical protein
MQRLAPSPAGGGATRTATPPQVITSLQAHGIITAGPCFAVVEKDHTGKP